MEIAVYNIQGKKTSKKVKLEDSVFGVEPNDHAIYLDVKQHMANKRQGTHCAKERSMLSGSTRKLRKQKGAGSARVGNITSPVFKGGARVFGPEPRDYSFKLNKKLKRIARKSALSYKVKDNNLVILEDFNMETPKTKAYVDMLKNLEVDDKRTVLVVPEADANLILSSRNLSNTKVVRATDLNTYDVLSANKVLIVESSVNAIENVLLK